jgi:hypothetical protein
MSSVSPSTDLRAALRARMLKRIDELRLGRKDAAQAMGFDRQQMWRFMSGEDVYSFDRLVDAATGLDLEVRVTAVRPWNAN